MMILTKIWISSALVVKCNRVLIITNYNDRNYRRPELHTHVLMCLKYYACSNDYLFMSSSDFKLSTEGPKCSFHLADMLLLYSPEKN